MSGVEHQTADPDSGSASQAIPGPIRAALVCDFLEEQWPSMDLVAEMTAMHLQAGMEVEPQILRPRFVRRFGKVSNSRRIGFNADRAFNRYFSYPRWLKAKKFDFDLFHIIDHSYAHLVHTLPAKRTVVTCHDLDAFRCIVRPIGGQRSRTLTALTRRVLSGIEKASRIICVSESTRREVLTELNIDPARLTVVRNGVDSIFSPAADPDADAKAARLLGPAQTDAIDVLHVGSTIPRKRIDVLLRVFSQIHRVYSKARLVRVGGALNSEQQRLAKQLGIGTTILSIPFVDRAVLASIYRRASLLLMPTESEGFGLPLVEAMACGLPAIASDLPVLREVGADAPVYCPVGDINRWRDAALELISERTRRPERREARRARLVECASRFDWRTTATETAKVYRAVLGELGLGAVSSHS